MLLLFFLAFFRQKQEMKNFNIFDKNHGLTRQETSNLATG